VLVPGFIVAGLGTGIANPVMASASVAVVPPQRSGMASGSANTFRQVGIATGIAGLGAVFQSQVKSKTLTALAGSADGHQVIVHGGAGLNQAITEGGVREALAAIPTAGARHALLHAYRLAFSATFDHLMIIAAIIAFAGSVAAFGLVRQRDFVMNEVPTSAEAAAIRASDRASSETPVIPAPVG
jgi:hypothetical protein